MIDYLSCILFKLFSLIMRCFPLGSRLFLGRRLGDFLYYFDLKHKAIAYSNIKTALGSKFSPARLSGVTKEFYQTFGQNIVEMFSVPFIDQKYIKKYITIEGAENIEDGFKRGKGIILLAMHEGSWEFSYLACASLGFPLHLFVRQQLSFPRLERLLNSYRVQKGCRLIYRQNQNRRIIETIKENKALGMNMDQGGRSGILVKFFGKDASMATGALKLALKYDVTILPVFFVRLKGPYIKIIVNQPFALKRSGDSEKDLGDNLQGITHLFEEYILNYPKEYFWTYKIWKHTREKNILILSDSKTGHLRQAEAVAEIASDYLINKGLAAKIEIKEVRFKNKLSRNALTFSSCFAGKYLCQGCLWCLRNFLARDNYESLIGIKPDIIISCGSAIAPVNYVLSRENQARSIVIMRPSILSTHRFDLVIMPKHDRPLRRKNVVVTDGALNLINEQYLKDQTQELLRASSGRLDARGIYIGLLIGGDTKTFHLRRDAVLGVIRQIKLAAETLNAAILVTTSRRTSREIEELVKKEFMGYSRCKFLVIANEKNIPEAVGAILGLSQFIITSPESISMISEAVSSRKYCLVFESGGLSNRHSEFLKHYARNKYIYFTEGNLLQKKIEEIWMSKPEVCASKDNSLVSEALKNIL